MNGHMTPIVVKIFMIEVINNNNKCKYLHVNNWFDF